MSIPNYRVTMSYDGERKVFTARAPELEHCGGEGATRGEAIAKLEEEMQAQLANMRAHGANPPAAVDEMTLTGELGLKVSQVLHRDLLWQARLEGVEVEQLAGEMLAAALEARRAGQRPQRAQNGRPQGDHQPNDNIGNNIGSGGNGGGAGANGNNRPNRGYGPRYNPQLLDDRANFIEYVRTLEQTGGAPPRGPGGGAPRNDAGADRRRRRGGGGGGTGGGMRGPGGPGGGNGGPNR